MSANRKPEVEAPNPSTEGASKWSCRILGHEIRYGEACAACGTDLGRRGKPAHIRHILSCFLVHHSFVWLGSRDGHQEYVCNQCGHPLLLEGRDAPRQDARSFIKRPRYWCSLFGHHVHRVTWRNGLTEYTCGCGHSFLLKRDGVKKIEHPLACTLEGHMVSFLTLRDDHAEYLCVRCGHPFLEKLS